MSGVPYVGLATVVDAGPELVSGLAARLRVVDLGIRARLELPLFCPDLADAMKHGTGRNLILVRDGERYGVYIRGFVVRSTSVNWAPALEASVLPASLLESVDSTAFTSGSRSQCSSTPASLLKSRGGVAATNAASKAAAKAAAARAAEDRLQRRAAVSASSHCLHGLSVLLQVRL